MKKLCLVVIGLLFCTTPCLASVNLTVYGTCQVVATLSMYEPLGDGWSTNGFLDIKQEGWFSKVNLTTPGKVAAVAQMRISDKSQVLAIGLQFEIKDKFGVTKLNLFAAEDNQSSIYLWQSHKLNQKIWTNGWWEYYPHFKNYKAEFQLGRKLTDRSDLVAEYRFGTGRKGQELAFGVQFGL